MFFDEDEYLHFQWLGSDYNPQGNDGEGRDGTDRSNMVFIDSQKDNLPSSSSSSNNSNFTETQQSIFTAETRKTLASLNQPITDAEQCYTFEELANQNKRNDEQSLKNCALLNRAEPYFNLFPVKPVAQTSQKSQNLMSSRNNNFSNRGQKLTILVLPSSTITTIQSLSNRNQQSLLISSSSPTSPMTTSQVNPAIIIASVIGGIIIITLIVSAIYNRHTVSKKYLALKRKWTQNTSSYI